MGFLSALFLVFLVMKLTEFIDWSWWLVFAPLIGEAVLGLLMLVTVMAATAHSNRRGGR